MKRVNLMKKNPIWFNLLSIIVIVIAITSLITRASFFHLATMLGLAVVMASLGSLEFYKNRKLAYMLFCVALLQVVVFIDSIVVFASK